MHAGMILNRFKRLKGDGKTAHERVKGRKSRKELCEFGEANVYMPADALQKPSMEPRWLEGYGWV